MKIVWRLWKRLKKYRVALVLLFLLVIVSNLLSLLTPLLSGYAVDAIVNNEGGVDFSAVFKNCALMFLCYIVSAGLTYVTSVRLIRLGQDVSLDLRREVFEKLSALPVSYFDTHPAGDIISRICYDIDTVNAKLSTDLLQVITSLVTVIGSIAMLLAISPVLCLVFAITVPVRSSLETADAKAPRNIANARNGLADERVVEENIAGQKTVVPIRGCHDSPVLKRTRRRPRRF